MRAARQDTSVSAHGKHDGYRVSSREMFNSAMRTNAADTAPAHFSLSATASAKTMIAVPCTSRCCLCQRAKRIRTNEPLHIEAAIIVRPIVINLLVRIEFSHQRDDCLTTLKPQQSRLIQIGSKFACLIEIKKRARGCFNTII